MAAHFTVTLDTTAPAGVSLTINEGAGFTAVRDVIVDLITSDGDTTGYQMKIWGDVDPAFDANVQTTEGASAWVTLDQTDFAVRLSTGDGSKTLNGKIRDDVWNESSGVSDTITLDSSFPVPNITVGPDTTRVSKVSGKRTVSFSWQPDVAIEEYKIKVVPATNSLHTAGTTIPETNSTNMSETASIGAGSTINSVADGRDIETASSGDGDKIIKIFVREASGNWSV